MNTKMIKKIKRRYVYFWNSGRLYAWDKRRGRELHTDIFTQYLMIRNACGFFVAEKYLTRGARK